VDLLRTNSRGPKERSRGEAASGRLPIQGLQTSCSSSITQELEAIKDYELSRASMQELGEPAITTPFAPPAAIPGAPGPIQSTRVSSTFDSRRTVANRQGNAKAKERRRS